MENEERNNGSFKVTNGGAFILIWYLKDLLMPEDSILFFLSILHFFIQTNRGKPIFRFICYTILLPYHLRVVPIRSDNGTDKEV
jgi:hypothetical protein